MTQSGILLRGYQGIVAHWRAIIALLIFAPAAFYLTQLNLYFALIGLALVLIFIREEYASRERLWRAIHRSWFGY